MGRGSTGTRQEKGRVQVAAMGPGRGRGGDKGRPLLERDVGLGGRFPPATHPLCSLPCREIISWGMKEWVLGNRQMGQDPSWSTVAAGKRWGGAGEGGGRGP